MKGDLSRKRRFRNAGCGILAVMGICWVMAIPQYALWIASRVAQEWGHFRFESNRYSVNDLIGQPIFKKYEVTYKAAEDDVTYIEWDYRKAYALIIGDPVEHLAVYHRRGVLIMDSKMGHIDFNGLGVERIPLSGDSRQFWMDVIGQYWLNLNMDQDFVNLLKGDILIKN